MRETLYKAKRVNDNDWVYGYYAIVENCMSADGDPTKHIICNGTTLFNDVIIPETLCEYTGCSEFTIVEGYGEKLFENDIVEIWRERAVYGQIQSQYDGWIKIRGVIRFKNGGFYIDLDNKYNASIFKARGLEEYDRDFIKTKHLVEFHWITPDRLQWQQEHNGHYKFGDIVRIGNIFDNPELLDVNNKGE